MEGLSDRKLLKPVKHKLKGDISLAEGDFGAAVMQFRKACKAAGIDGPEEGGLASDASPEETAKHCKQQGIPCHAATVLSDENL